MSPCYTVLKNKVMFINNNLSLLSMFDRRIDRYSSALVIGTGGGNDIVSTLIPAQHLHRRGIKTDIAGVLSPAAVHRFNGNLEKVVNTIDGNVERVIPAPEVIPISFVDGSLPIFARNCGIEIDSFYDFSIRYGTSRLVEGVNELIEQRGYDLVVAVDVGGDILARGNEDNTLLSPVMDFTSLYLMGQIDIDVLLLEFGLGTDGELRPAGMEQILNGLRRDDLMLYESSITAQDAEVRKFREIFDNVRKIRAGHTGVMTLETLDTKSSKDIITEYKFKSQIGRKKWYTPFEVVLSNQYAGRTYLVDGKGLAEQRTQTAFPYENSLHQYVKLKGICPEWKTEMDLFYLWDGDNWTSPNNQKHSLFLLTPSTSIPSDERREIIQYGIQHSNSDMVLLWKSDLEDVDVSRFSLAESGQFVLLSKNNPVLLRKTADQVQQYHQ
jgi:hypothetical protein